MRERLAVADVPEPFQGAAIGMITAGLASLAFMGFRWSHLMLSALTEQPLLIALLALLSLGGYLRCPARVRCGAVSGGRQSD